MIDEKTTTYKFNIDEQTETVRQGTSKLDNDTYIEMQNTIETNKEDRFSTIIGLWKKTNFWIACIGFYFLCKIIIAIIKFICTIYISKNVIELISNVLA